jgi:hypothetical protein
MTMVEDNISTLSKVKDNNSKISKLSQASRPTKLSQLSFNSQYTRFPTKDIVDRVKEKY